MAKGIIDYFVVNGTSSYPDDVKFFNSLEEVFYLGERKYLVDYTGAALQFEATEEEYLNSLVDAEKPILVTVTLDKTSAKLENGSVSVGYIISFNEPITSPQAVDVPISITDRNGLHVDNIGLSIPANTPTDEFTGTFVIDKRGDFTVTDEAINFHESTGMNIIDRRLELVKQPWLRVYQ